MGKDLPQTKAKTNMQWDPQRPPAKAKATAFAANRKQKINVLCHKIFECKVRLGLGLGLEPRPKLRFRFRLVSIAAFLACCLYSRPCCWVQDISSRRAPARPRPPRHPRPLGWITNWSRQRFIFSSIFQLSGTILCCFLRFLAKRKVKSIEFGKRPLRFCLASADWNLQFW